MSAEGQKEAIVILGGSLHQDDSGVWRTIGAEGGDNHGVTADRWRIDAARVLYDRASRPIFVSGGRGQLEGIPDVPTIASVMKKELVELGVPAEMIYEEDTSGNTYEQLHALAPLAQKMGCTAMLILTSRWHMPRVEAMIAHAPGLAEVYDPIRVDIVAAEDVLLEDAPEKWRTVVTEVYESTPMHERQAREQIGIESIKNGTYVFKR